jgi:hypothetical protein
MNNTDFWTSISQVISDGFTPQGLKTLDYYAEQFISNRLVYKRFSSREQHGCAAGGETNVVASILAAAEDRTNTNAAKTLSDYQRECQQGAKLAECESLQAKLTSLFGAADLWFSN